MKYNVYALYSTSKLLGTYEADSPADAIQKCESDLEADIYAGLCHQCSEEIGDLNFTDYEAELDQ